MKKKMIFIYTLLLGFLFADNIMASYSSTSTPLTSNEEILIKLTFNDQQAIAMLIDNPTTQSLLKQLPITIPFEDYARTEKIAYLSSRLTTQSDQGHHPKKGDITYYTPWGNLAFFYQDVTASGSLIYMGKFISGLDEFSRQGAKFNVTIARIE